MRNNTPFIAAFVFSALMMAMQPTSAKAHFSAAYHITQTDSVPDAEIMAIVKTVIHSLNKFDIDQVADLYTQNAVVADDEAPYSWNGPTAGIQWVNAVEKAAKDNRLKKLEGEIEPVNVFHSSGDGYYVVVPVTFSGNLPGGQTYTAEGAFTFVLKMVTGHWRIKATVGML